MANSSDATMHGELREIGSEFWDVPLASGEPACLSGTILERQISAHLDETSFFSSGRAALGAILDDAIKRHGIQSVLMPAYCCESMIRPAAVRGLAIRYYSITGSVGRGIRVDFGGQSADAVIVVDYFGLSFLDDSHCTFPDSLVIRDLTHSLFSSRPLGKGDYCFGSLRKWAGFYTGGIAWSPGCRLNPTYAEGVDEYAIIRKKAMEAKRQYINAESGSKDFLLDFARAESLLESAKVSRADDSDIDYLLMLDYVSICSARKRNFDELMRALRPMSLFSCCSSLDTPLFFPIMVAPSDRDALRDHLIANQIYCPVHWPVANEKVRGLAPELYSSELSLVCDQRYDERDMRRIADTVLSFWS